MTSRYLDLENINHLMERSRGGGIFDNKLWRESYYFNMTDPKNNISMITTIGLLPNKKRSLGFLLIIKEGKPIFLKPLISLKEPRFSGYEFRISDMTYSIQGTDWRLKYHGKKVALDLRFSPINRIYPYRKESDQDWDLDPIGAQHYEQFGSYSGTLEIDGTEVTIGPCLGHRDHSWGIRDWSSLDRYSLHCCAFSKELAFNLWEGSIGGRSFFRGFVFDGKENVDIVDREIKTRFQSNGREPIISDLTFRDSHDREYHVKCRSVASVPFPPQGSIVHEGIGRMTMDGNVGYGLQEYLHHVQYEYRRLPFFLGLLRIKGVVR